MKVFRRGEAWRGAAAPEFNFFGRRLEL